MQTIKVECQECEEVKTYETKSVGLIMRTPEDKLVFIGHNCSVLESLVNLLRVMQKDDPSPFLSKLIKKLREKGL